MTMILLKVDPAHVEDGEGAEDAEVAEVRG
jgi:hypothetical protein